MFNFSIKEFILSVVANVAAANISGEEMIGYLFGVACLVAWVIGWHRRQLAAKKTGMGSTWFIALACLVAVISVGAAAYGLGLRGQKGPEASATEVTNPAPVASTGSILLAHRYYSAKNKEEVADRLDQIADVFNKTGEQLFLLSEAAINQSPWDRPGENLAPYIARMTEITTLTAKIHNDLYVQLVPKERDYGEEINKIVFPMDTFMNFQTAANEFRNGLVVWSKMRDTADSEAKSILLNLVMAARRNFGSARDRFLTWTSERINIIGQTRRALKS